MTASTPGVLAWLLVGGCIWPGVAVDPCSVDAGATEVVPGNDDYAYVELDIPEAYRPQTSSVYFAEEAGAVVGLRASSTAGPSVAYLLDDTCQVVAEAEGDNAFVAYSLPRTANYFVATDLVNGASGGSQLVEVLTFDQDPGGACGASTEVLQADELSTTSEQRYDGSLTTDLPEASDGTVYLDVEVLAFAGLTLEVEVATHGTFDGNVQLWGPDCEPVATDNDVGELCAYDPATGLYTADCDPRLEHTPDRTGMYTIVVGHADTGRQDLPGSFELSVTGLGPEIDP